MNTTANGYEKDLQFDLILPRVKGMSKKQILIQLSKAAAKHLNRSETSLLDALLTKEHARSSGIGDGTAMPNIKIKGLLRPFALLATLNQSIDFEANDEVPVDLVAVIISPESEGPKHLRRLSRVSRLLKNDDLHQKLCEADDADIIQSLLIDPEGWLLAA